MKHSIWYRLFFVVSEDEKRVELDLGWLLLLIGFLNAVLVFDLVAARVWTMSPIGWGFYGGVMAMSFIAGSTVAKARILADSKLPGDVIKSLSSFPSFGPKTSAFDDASK